jgi:hypothetical protein
MLIGPSRIVRKTTALSLGEKIVKEVDSNIILPSYFSPEGLIEYLSEAKDSKVVAWVRDEIGGFFKELEKQYMLGTREIFSSLYSGKEIRRKLRSREFYIPDGIYITILSSLPTPAYSYLHEEDFTSGFLNRFLLLYRSRRDKDIPILNTNNEVEVTRRGIVNRFRELSALLTNMNPPPIISFAYDALKEIESYEKEVDKEIVRIEETTPESLWKLYLAETPKFLLKLSALHRLADYEKGIENEVFMIVRKEDVMEAKNFLMDVLDTAKILVSDVQMSSRPKIVYSEQKALDKIYDIVRADGVNGISFSELLSRTRLLRRDLLNYLDTLYWSRKVILVKARSKEKSGRRAVFVFPYEAESKAVLIGDIVSPRQLMD